MDLRLSKKVRSIVVMAPEQGRWQSTALYKKKRRKRKKGTRLLRPLEKAVRRVSTAGNTYTQTYLKRHKKANRKKRDGWLRRLNYNVYRAARKSQKKLNIIPVWF